mgnify:CR=1 FL=1
MISIPCEGFFNLHFDGAFFDFLQKADFVKSATFLNYIIWRSTAILKP